MSITNIEKTLIFNINLLKEIALVIIYSKKQQVMVNYQMAKIYKIISDSTNKIYVGCTTKKYLSQRMEHHRRQYKKWLNNESTRCTSFDIIQFPDAKIILIESCQCKDKDEMAAKERFHIEANRDLAVNKQIPGRKAAEWRLDNKEHIKQFLHNYNINNKEKLNPRFNCECGGRYTRGRGKERHEKSKKHIAFKEI